MWILASKVDPPTDKPILIGWWDAKGKWQERRVWWDPEFRCVAINDEGDTGYEGAWTDNAVANWGMQENHSYAPEYWRHLPPPPSHKPKFHRRG